MLKENASACVRGVFRRPDVWAVAVAFLAFVTVLATTNITVARASRFAYNHLADSFGVGLFSAVSIIFIESLLRRAPAGPRRALRLVWIGLTLLLTAGLLLAYARSELHRTNWILQGLVLALLGTGALLCLLLPGLGLVRWRDASDVAWDIARQWGSILFFLMFGGYLLGAVRLARPEVIDAILLRMDGSLGIHLGERIATWTTARPWAIVATNYGYPLLGAVIAGTAACLHLARNIAGLRRLLLACILVSLFGKFCYWAAPAIGPIYAYPELYAYSEFSADALRPGGAAGLDALRAAALAGPDRVALRPELPRNVMPSLHATFTLVVLAAAWCHRRRLFWWWLPLGAVQIVTTLTLVVHYVVDLIAAVPFAIFCWGLADAGVRRFAPAGAEPLPDLVVTGPRRRRLRLMLASSLALALGLLVLWGRYAPIPPALAWLFVALCAGLPAWLALRLFTAEKTGRATLCVSIAAPSAVRPARLLAGAVFCTGGTALVLEQVAEKYLSTLLGASRPAATIVLAVYFTGLALGALLCPKRPAGAPRRLAGLELFIAAWAALLAGAFFATDRVLGGWLATAGTDATSLALARAALAALWLLPPTLAMGAQLPTLAAVLSGHPALHGESLPRYYAINLAGAFAFTLAAPPLLFNTVGANGALWFVAMLAALVGVALWSGLPKSEETKEAAAAPESSPPSTPPFALPTLLWAFAAGFAFFALEVVWFHLIGAVCGASTYSFTLLLAAVLFALALAGRHAAPHAATPAAVLGWLVAALAVSNALWPWAGRLLAWIAGLLGLEWFWAGEALKFAVVLLIVLPPAFALGRIFPLLLGARGDSAHVGRLSVANVLGCVAGALAAGFLFIPAFGAERTLLGLALLAAAGWVAQLRSLRLRALMPGAAGLALLAALPGWDRLELTRGFGVYLSAGVAPDAKLLSFSEDFQAGFVTVIETPRAGGGVTRSLLQNGKFDADDAGEVPAQVGFGVVAATHAPAQNRALVIGAGSGQTASVIARLGFAQVDIAELSPAHLATAREYFDHLNGGLFERPEVRVFVEDGRQHLLRTRDRHDLIQIELTSVWFAGATNLYSREFYALARDRLAAGGVLVQWIQLHHLTAREIGTILATARAEFGLVSVWRVGGQACLLASNTPQRFNPAVVERWLSAPDLAAERRAVRVDSPENFAIARLLTPAEVDRLLDRYRAGLGINTDRNRWLEFQTPKYYLSRRDHPAENLHWLGALGTTP